MARKRILVVFGKSGDTAPTPHCFCGAKDSAGKAASIVSVADPIKASTPEALRSLHALGLKILMLTGDNHLNFHVLSSNAL